MTGKSFYSTSSRFVFQQMEEDNAEKVKGKNLGALMSLRFCSTRTLSLTAASIHIVINGIILTLVSFPVLSGETVIVGHSSSPFQEFLFNFNSASLYHTLVSSEITVFLWYLFSFIWGIALLYGVLKEHSATLSFVIGVKLMKIIGSLMTFFVSVLLVPQMLLSVPLLLLVVSVYFMPLPVNLLLLPMYLWTFGQEIFLWVLASSLLDYWIVCILNDFQLKLKHSH